MLVSITEVKIGQILKLHGIYCAVVLDKFISGDGGVILRVQTLRNVFRGFKSELIDTSVAPNGLHVASMDDIDAEIAEHKRTVEQGLSLMMEAVRASGTHG